MLDRKINKMDAIFTRGLNEMNVIIFKISKDKQNNYIRPQLDIDQSNIKLYYTSVKMFPI